MLGSIPKARSLNHAFPMVRAASAETGAQLREQDPRIAPNRGPISQLAGWLRQTTYILTLKPPTARNAAFFFRSELGAG